MNAIVGGQSNAVVPRPPPAAPFDACLAFTLAEEGGYSNDPRDPGGATNLGVTLATLSHWRGVACTPADVRGLTVGEATAIYRACYWNTVRAASMPHGVDLMVFDHAVNAGPSASVKLLQRVLGIQADGIVGPQTIGAAANARPISTIQSLQTLTDAAYRATANFDRYGNGWLGRLSRRTALALQMAAAG